MFQDGFDLLFDHTGKPFEEVGHPSAAFEVLEERLDRHAGSPKDPCPAHSFRVALCSRTGGPIEHRVVALDRDESETTARCYSTKPHGFGGPSARSQSRSM